MNIEEYTDPVDPYAPRPDASKRVAAQHRARQDAEPDLPQAAQAPARRQLLAGAMAILILAFVGAASYQLARLPQARPLAITPVATEAAPTEPAHAFGNAPTASPAPRTATEAPRPPTFTPVPPAPPVEPPPQTGQGLTLNNEWTPPETTPPPAPEPTATVVWPTSAPVSRADFDKPDIRATCQFIGCLGQLVVDLERANTCHALFRVYGDADPETIPEPDLSAVRGCIWEGLYR